MVPWEPWGEAAFARASREGKPVLLSISAAWCRACHEMDRTTYADPSIETFVRDRFVPVRVDTDHRPDINDRYNLGGWPTTAFLTADGRVITGGTFIGADQMPRVLARVLDAFAARAAEWATDTALTAERAEELQSPGDAEDTLIGMIFSTFDEEHGGFGVEPKFPIVAPIHLALALYRDTREGRWRAIVERTLDAMWSGGLRDAKAGGFYRYAATRDWQQPHIERLLETNAALLAVYVDAAVVLARSEDRDRAAAIARFITTTLRDERGGYRGSDASAALYADGNAVALSALLRAAALLDDEGLVREALASFERVLLACYKPGGGLAHVMGHGVRGLLNDQIAAVTALLDAHAVTDGEPYQMMAEEIGHYAVAELQDGDGFVDRAACPDDVGLLRSRRKPFVTNADAAVALVRLQGVSREFDFTAAAAGALAVAARLAPQQGPLAAHYVLAARQLR
jgi:uncharacterized protein YyaL (SSP411 family)